MCDQMPGCNVITYNDDSGKCHLQFIPPQERKVLEVMPRAFDCVEKHTAWTWWHGDPHGTDGHEKVPENWHLFCHGYIEDSTDWHTAYGQTEERNLGKTGCMKVCEKLADCNFVTYDTTTGQCFQEHIKHMPDHCDGNDHGWSYMRNDHHAIEALEADDGGDGWHFVCSGFVTTEMAQSAAAELAIFHFERADADGDGVLSLEEMTAVYPDESASEIERIFNLLDVDGDGGLDLEELKAGFGHKEFGQASEQHLGHNGCKDACLERDGCNFVTYDSWTGICWMESFPDMPDWNHCDDNDAGWSYWHGTAQH